ncbi:hypothetical protein [Burkholderia anthina]|uniref:hypothetical protein n=1 Tax=Burkholderia anthina TaxID=179879 RepID=UPI00158E5253|nr:hypothetical protein [Burkholderia anthina]
MTARLARIEAAMSARELKTEAAMLRLVSEMATLSSAVTRISDLIAAAAQSDDDEEGISNSKTRLPNLADWLIRESRALAQPIRKSAVLSAQWLATRHIYDSYVSMEFSASITAVDGASKLSALLPSSQFRVDLVKVDEPFARISSTNRIALVCRVGAGGRWGVEAFSIDTSGAQRELIATRDC